MNWFEACDMLRRGAILIRESIPEIRFRLSRYGIELLRDDSIVIMNSPSVEMESATDWVMV